MTNYIDISDLHFEDVDVHGLLAELHELKVLLAVIETKIAEFHTRWMR